MTSRRSLDVLVPALMLLLAACSSSKPAGKDATPPDAADSSDAADAADAHDAPPAFDCRGAGGGACNDNPAVSSIWGVCAADGQCRCNPGFAVNPDTGKCRPAAATDGGDAGEANDSDGPAAALPAWQSGTRLRARLLKVTDATDAIFEGITDKDLAVPCAFTQASDGATRCMPPAVVPSFSDDTCKTPLLPLNTGCAPATHVSIVTDCHSTGFEVAAKVTPVKVFELRPDGTCAELPGGEKRDLYALTALPATSFVAATEARDDRGSALQMRYWKSDDGGSFPIGAWDKSRGAACEAGTADFAEHCVPARVARAGTAFRTFADSMCKVLVGTADKTCGPDPVSAVTVTDYGSCSQATTYYAEATSLTTPPYQGYMGCMQSGPAAPETLFVPGAKIPAGAMPALPTVFEGAGRLKVRRADVGAGLRIDSPATYYDEAQTESCVPTDTSNGLRCVPTSADRVYQFSDDKCTTPVYLRPIPDACPATRTKVAYVQGNAACGGPPTIELYDVGAAVTPAHLYQRGFNGACMVTTYDPAITAVYALTPATAATAARLERVTE